MKKHLILAMALTIAFSVNKASAAAGRSVIELRTEAGKANEHSLDHGAIDALHGVPDAQVLNETSKQLASIGGAIKEEVQAALGYTAEVTQADGTKKSYKLADLAKKIMGLDQFVTKLNINELSEDGKKHVEALKEATSEAAKFLSMASVRSNQRPGSNAKQVAIFNKQLSLIGDLASMDTADLLAHAAMMKKAYVARIAPEVDGDLAFSAALRGGKIVEVKLGDGSKGFVIQGSTMTEEQYLAKVQEILDCISGAI